MRSGLKRAAFTLIELLVVVAIIALLLSILLPSLSAAREQGKRAKCLSNLRSLGSSMYQYANDDSAEQLIPIALQQVLDASKLGPTSDSGNALWRTVNWFTWGGRSGQKAFKTSGNGGYKLGDPNIQDSGCPGAVARPDYAADRRPLNLYIISGVSVGDSKRMEWFSCPGDTGYPDDPSIDDSPIANALRPCYDTIGSSYRASMANVCLLSGSGLSAQQAAFSLGVWGLRASSLQDTGKTIMVGEPTFFNMIGRDEGDTSFAVPVPGWHKRLMTDNLLFCDGSARSTRAENPVHSSQELLNDLAAFGGDPEWIVKHRGASYKLDTYPVGGAIIWGRTNLASSLFNNADDMKKYPFRNMQDNLRAD